MNLADYLGKPIMLEKGTSIVYPERTNHTADIFLYLMDSRLQTLENNGEIMDRYPENMHQLEFVGCYVVYIDHEDNNVTTESKYRLITLDRFKELVEISERHSNRFVNFKWSANNERKRENL